MKNYYYLINIVVIDNQVHCVNIYMWQCYCPGGPWPEPAVRTGSDCQSSHLINIVPLYIYTHIHSKASIMQTYI